MPKLYRLNITNLPKIYGDVKVFETISNKNWISIAIYSTSISGNLSSFRNITISEYFGLGGTQVTGAINVLSSMKDAMRLSFEQNYNITGDVSVFKTFTNLTYLAVNT